MYVGIKKVFWRYVLGGTFLELRFLGCVSGSAEGAGEGPPRAAAPTDAPWGKKKEAQSNDTHRRAAAANRSTPNQRA